MLRERGLRLVALFVRGAGRDRLALVDGLAIVVGTRARRRSGASGRNRGSSAPPSEWAVG